MSSQINYTQTYLADHIQNVSHDAVNRYLRKDRVTPRDVWEVTKAEIVLSPNGYLVFDDSVLDKNHSRKMELVKKQYSGNAKRVIRGIGFISCVYVNPDTGQYWLIAFRIYNPLQDHKDKHQHVSELFELCCQRDQQGSLSFKYVLMDQWYATKDLMLQIDRAKKVFYCPIKDNRKFAFPDQSEKKIVSGKEKLIYKYQLIKDREWQEEDLEHGITIHLNEFPAGVDVKLFRIVFASKDTEFVVTNDNESLLNASIIAERYGWRWKVEQFHREFKGVTGVDACQCRNGRAQRNHIGCAVLVWLRLKILAMEAKTTVYALKEGLLSHYMKMQLANPTLRFA